MLVDYAEVFQVGNSVDLFGFFPFLSTSLLRGKQTITKKNRHESSEAPATGYEICISAIATTGETEEPHRFSLPSASSPSSTHPFHGAVRSSSSSHQHLSSSPSVVSLFVPSTVVVVGTTTGDLIGFQRYPYSSPSSCVPSSVSRIELMFFVHRYHYGPIYDIAVEPRSLRLATAGHDAVCQLTSWNTLVRWYAGGETWKSHKRSALARSMHEDGEGESRTHDDVPTASTPSGSVHGFHADTWSSSSRVSSRELETLSVCGRRKGKGVGSSPEWSSTVAAVFSAMPKPPGVVVLSGHSLPVVKAQFTMDGRHVFSLSVDGHLREHALHGIVVERFGIEGACSGSAGGELSSVSSLSSSSPFLSRLGSASTSSGGCSEQVISSRDFFCTRVCSASPPSTSRTSRRVLMSTFVLSPDETFAVVAGEGIEWIDLRFLREDGPSYYVGEKEEEEDSHFSSSFLHESEMEGKEKSEWKRRDALPSQNGADNDNEKHKTSDAPQGRMLLLSPQQRTWWSCIESYGGGASLSLSSSSPSPDLFASASEDFLLSSLHITSLRWLPWSSGAAPLSVSTGSPRHFPLSGCITYRLAGTVVGRRERRSWNPQAKKDAASAEEERGAQAAPSTSPSSPSAAVSHDGEVPSPQYTRESGASREEHQEDALPATTPSSVVLGELFWAERPGCGIPTTRRRGGGENDGAASPSWFSPHRMSGSCLHPPARMEDDGEKVEEKEEKAPSPCSSSSFSPCWWMHDLNDHRATASLWREKNIYPCAAAFPFPSSSSLTPTSVSSALQHTLRRRGILSTRGEVLEHLRCRKRQLHETCNFLFKKLKEEVAVENCS